MLPPSGTLPVPVIIPPSLGFAVADTVNTSTLSIKFPNMVWSVITLVRVSTGSVPKMVPFSLQFSNINPVFAKAFSVISEP